LFHFASTVCSGVVSQRSLGSDPNGGAHGFYFLMGLLVDHHKSRFDHACLSRMAAALVANARDVRIGLSSPTELLFDAIAMSSRHLLSLGHAIASLHAGDIGACSAHRRRSKHCARQGFGRGNNDVAPWDRDGALTMNEIVPRSVRSRAYKSCTRRIHNTRSIAGARPRGGVRAVTLDSGQLVRERDWHHVRTTTQAGQKTCYRCR